MSLSKRAEMSHLEKDSISHSLNIVIFASQGFGRDVIEYSSTRLSLGHTDRRLKFKSITLKEEKKSSKHFICS